MDESFICSGALMRCSCGSQLAKIIVHSDRTVDLSKEPMANQDDWKPYENISPFGMCCSSLYPPTARSKHPTPCQPGTHFYWINCKDDFIVRDWPALTTRSHCNCKWGGEITFVLDGQTPNTINIEREPAMLLQGFISKTENPNLDNEKDESWTWLDTVEIVPVVGSFVGMGRSAMNGNWGLVAMNVGFLALDIAGLASMGSTTVASTAAKTALKTGVKATEKAVPKLMTLTAKKSSPKLLELTLGKDGAEILAKEGVNESSKQLGLNNMTKTVSEDMQSIVVKTGAKSIKKIEEWIRQVGETTTKAIEYNVEKIRNNIEIPVISQTIRAIKLRKLNRLINEGHGPKTPNSLSDKINSIMNLEK